MLWLASFTGLNFESALKSIHCMKDHFPKHALVLFSYGFQEGAGSKIHSLGRPDKFESRAISRGLRVKIPLVKVTVHFGGLSPRNMSLTKIFTEH